MAVQDVRFNMKFEWARAGKRRKQLEVAKSPMGFERLEERSETLPSIGVMSVRREHGQCFQRVSGGIDARTHSQDLAEKEICHAI
jgi:hypothetical protein